MKAVYINLDPYLAAFAAWIKGGKSGPAPSFQPIPLAVAVPLGQDVAVLFPLVGDTEGEFSTNDATIDGVTVKFAESLPPQNVVMYNFVAGLSTVAPSAKYAVALVSGSTASSDIAILDENEENEMRIPFTVLVNRETASGPVDLVDFTPPAAAPSAADIKSALVAAGTGALEGVSLAGTVLNENDSIASDAGSNHLKPVSVGPDDKIETIIGYVTQS